MKIVVTAVSLALAAVSLSAGSADAKGCIKGALVGGVAGHLAHHGLMGAAAGCAIGHHRAATKAREERMQNSQAATQH